MPSLFSYPARNWRTATHKDHLPALGLKLSSLMDRLKVSVTLFLNLKKGLHNVFYLHLEYKILAYISLLSL